MRYREVFFAANGFAPWACDYCGLPVDHDGAGSSGLVVHHVDEDQVNSAVENLVAMHRECHIKHHHTGKVGVSPSPEFRQQMSQRFKGVPKTEAHRAALSLANKGVPKSQVHKDALVAKMRTRSLCQECGQSFNPQWMTRHKNEGRCK